MRTAFHAEQLTDPHMKDAERALRTCVHCGFCTATCPTYLLLGDERDGPRGRIVLMQHMLESGVSPTAETVKHLDRCLSCLGCKTACPSGVDYSALIDTSRAYIETHYKRPMTERVFRAFLLFVLTRPKLFAALTGISRRLAPILTHLPGKLGVLSRKAGVAHRKPVDRSRPEVSPTAPRVLLLPGCVQRVLAPEIDAAAARVLARGDMRVEQLERSGCCGALAYHMGKADIGKDFARGMIRAYEAEAAKGSVQAVLITASGCAAFLKDYPRVFADEPEWKTRAEALAAKVKDFTELAKPAAKSSQAAAPVIAFHPPCTLQHGQKIHGRGEALLAAAGFRLAPIPDAHLCCGSAGSYSLLQPEIAEQLRARKLAAIRSTGAEIIASANIGCLTHLAGELPTIHIAELLDWAGGGPYFADPSPPPLASRAPPP